MDERNACALLKRRFEAAGYRIEANAAELGERADEFLAGLKKKAGKKA